jgi:hypothetical protein
MLVAVRKLTPYVLGGLIGLAAGYFLSPSNKGCMAELERISLELRLCQEKLPK